MPQRGAVAVSSRLAGRDAALADASPGPTTFPSDTTSRGNLLNDINAASLPVTGEDAPNLRNDAHRHPQPAETASTHVSRSFYIVTVNA